MSDVVISMSAVTSAAEAALSNFAHKVTDQFGDLGKKLTAFFATEKLIEFGARVIENADAMGKFSQKTGIATETLSAYTLGAKQANATQEDLQTGLKALALNLVELSRGGEGARDSFKAIGLEGRSFTNLDDALQAIAERMQALPKGFEKTEAAVRLMGRSGENLIPFLNQGSEGLRKMKDVAEATGQVISGETAEAADTFNTNLSTLKATVEGFGKSVVTELLPHLVQLSETLNDNSRAAEGLHQKASDVATVLKAVATAALAVWHSLKLVAEFMAGQFLTAGLLIRNALLGLQEVFLSLQHGVLRVGQAFIDSIKALGGFGDVVDKLVHRDFKGAWEAASATVVNFGKSAGEVVGGFTETWGLLTDLVGKRFGVTWEQIKSGYKVVLSDMQDEGEAFMKRFSALWDKPAGKTSEPSGAAGAGKDKFVPINSAEGKKAIDEIAKAWEEAFFSRRQLLGQEYVDQRSRVQTEIKDKEDLGRALLMLDETYLRKRANLEREEAAARAAVTLSQLQGQRARLEADPEKGKAEKKALLLPLLQQENDLIGRQLETYSRLAQDQTVTDETRIEAAKQLVALEQQRTDLLARQRELNRVSSDFPQLGGTAANNLKVDPITGEQSMLDPYKELDNFLNTSLNTTFQGINDSIRGMIDGSRTWGEVMVGVLDSMLSGIINLILEYTLFHQIRMLLDKVFNVTRIAGITTVAAAGATATAATTATSTTAAAATTTAWTPAAIMASIASMGVAGWIGLAVVLAAVGYGLSQAFSEGGPVTGPGSGTSDSIPSRLSNGEFVIRAAAVKKFGSGFFADLNDGVLNAYALAGALPGSLTRPITSDAAAMQQLASDAAAASGGAGGGGGGNIHVAPAGVHVAVLNSDDQIRRFMESKAGERIHFTHANNLKNELGIPS